MASIWGELKRRNVFKVAVFYVVASWVVLQVADLIFEMLGVPASWLRGVLVLLVLGFPVSLVVSWIFEVTPDGIRRDSEIDASQSSRSTAGNRLSIATIALVVIAIALLLTDRFVWRAQEQPPVTTQAQREVTEQGVPTVAVLPFKAIGSEDGGFLAGGLHDDLLTRLAKLKAFRVISRTSVMEYADTTKNMRQIGAELNARYILEGGVQAMGSRIRVNAQLIDTEDDEHVWAESFDHELTAANIFDIQASLASSIAAEMKTSLTPADRDLIEQIPTQSMEAYNAYLRGLSLRDVGGHNTLNNEIVIRAFEEAVKHDPQFAQGWAQLSIERSRVAQAAGPQGGNDAALTALETAQELDPTLREVEVARAVYLYRVLFEYQQALEILEGLAASHPLRPTELMLKAYILRRLGRWTEAYETAVEAQRMDPRSIAMLSNLIRLAWQAHHCRAAGEYVRAGFALDERAVSIRVAAATYELNCNGNGERANQLLSGLNFNGYFQVLVARDAAHAARDYERVLELTQHSVPITAPPRRILDQLVRVTALRALDRQVEAAELLASTGEEMQAVTGRSRDSWLFATVNGLYHALEGNAEEVRYWLEESDRRMIEQTKGDSSLAAAQIWRKANMLVMAGAFDEGLELLKEMVDTPGADRMPFINLLEEFDAIRHRDEFIALLKRQSDAD